MREVLRTNDVIVAPSVWWENSPVVIREARRNRIPIICSDIGGMAETISGVAARIASWITTGEFSHQIEGTIAQPTERISSTASIGS